MKRAVMSLAAFVAVGLFAVTGCQKTTSEGPGGKTLSVDKPSDVTIKAGDKKDVKISIKRNGFKEPVSVTFEDLPKGVTLVDEGKKIGADETSGTFRFNADPDAKPGEKLVKVVVKGGDTTVPTDFKMTVKAQ